MFGKSSSNLTLSQISICILQYNHTDLILKYLQNNYLRLTKLFDGVFLKLLSRNQKAEVNHEVSLSIFPNPPSEIL